MTTPNPSGPALERPEPVARPGPRLLWEADALLALIPQLRASGFVSDLRRLHQELSGMLRDFQARARRDGIEPARVAQATEVLSAVIDHVVTSMPWGADASWQSLGAQPVPAGLHPGPHGSATRLLEVAHRSSADPGMRELIGIALALGFEGGGAAGADEVQINQLRAELAAQGPPAARIEHALSPPGEPAAYGGGALTAWLPLWVSSSVLAALLTALFIGLVLSLAVKSDRLYARIAALKAPAADATPLPAAQPRLAGLIGAAPAAAGVRVRDEIDRSILELPGAQLFAAGEAQLLPAGSALLRQVAAALQRVPGRVQVIGHTGSATRRAPRFPSDWDLSVARARTAAQALKQWGLDGARLSVDGRAGLEPAAATGTANGSAAAEDERLEIVLLAGR